MDSTVNATIRRASWVWHRKASYYILGFASAALVFTPFGEKEMFYLYQPLPRGQCYVGTETQYVVPLPLIR